MTLRETRMQAHFETEGRSFSFRQILKRRDGLFRFTDFLAFPEFVFPAEPGAGVNDRNPSLCDEFNNHNSAVNGSRN